jgi:hypothetical protein
MIRTSQAYSNCFFEAAAVQFTPQDLRTFVREWYPVTQAFCLGLPGYTAVFAHAVLEATGERRSRLEEAIRVPAQICAEELGLEGKDAEGIHYRMFARLGDPLGLELEDLRLESDGTIKETRALVSGIRECLQDLYLGAGCIRVVEATAYNIVQAMDRVFRPLCQASGDSLYADYQLEYISLHLVIEKEHDAMTQDFLAFAETDEERARIHEGAQRMSILLGDYWEKLAEVVFGRTTGQPGCR